MLALRALLVFCLYIILSLFSWHAFAQPNHAIESICVGLDADISLTAAESGEAIRRGALIAMHEINQRGGVLGKPMELLVRDHRSNPARGVDNIVELSELPHCVAVLGGKHTPVILNELETIQSVKIPVLVPWAAGTPIISNGSNPNYLFRLSLRDEYAGQFLLSNISKNGLTKIGVLLERTGWGRSSEKSIRAASNKMDMNIVGIEWFHWGVQDASESIQQLVDAGAQAFVMVSNSPEGAVVVNDIATHPVARSLPIYSHWGIADGGFVKKVGLETLQKVDLEFLQTFSFMNEPINPEVQRNVIALYQQLFDSAVNENNMPSPVGVAHAYDLTHLLGMAIEKAGALDREKIRASLEQLGRYEGLVRTYERPFTQDWHEALEQKDYIMGKFDEQGYIVPVKRIK